MAFLTGLEPHETGVLTNDDFLPSDIPTIAHALALSGYDCRLVGRMHFSGPDQLHGFAQRPIGDVGPTWPGAGPPDIGPLTQGRGNRGPELLHSGAGETSYQAYDHAVTEQALRTLQDLRTQRADTGRPFFVLISLFCPHPPYIARRDDYDRFADIVLPPRLPPPEIEHPAIAAWRRAGGIMDVPPDATAKSRIAYYGLVAMIDRLVGRIDDAIKEDANTVSIYCSDHGECLGERGLWWKSVFYDESAKVPLIIRAPGFSEGTVDHRVTSLIDLSATLLGWANAPVLPSHTGRDLRQLESSTRHISSSYYGGLMNIELPPVRHRMIRQGSLKLSWYDGMRPQLFDLEEDPDELRDLHDDPSHFDIQAEMVQQLFRRWNPSRLAAWQNSKRARTALIREWVQKGSIEEPSRWRDPNPGRNRYED